MSDFPPTWTETIFSSITTDAIQRIPEADEQFTYIDIGSIDRNSKSIVAAQRLLGADAPSRARKQVRSGDTLVSMTRPNLNAVALVPQELDGQIASTGFDVLRPVEGIDPRWISYLVRTDAFVKAMSDLVQGALYPAVRSKEVRSYRVPLAPSAEQTRIADQLDKLLARIQSCNDRLDAIPALLKRFRQAVLAAMTCGKLTENWREENESGAWIPSELAACGAVSGGLTKNAKRQTLTLIKPYLRVANVYANRLELSDVSEIGLTQSEYQKTKLRSGDLLIVEGNGSLDQLGRVALWSDELGDCVHQNHLIRWRTSGPLPKFVLYWLLSPRGRADLTNLASTTTGLHTLSISKVGAVPIDLPPMEEQAEIVRRVEALFKLAARIEVRHIAARTQAQRLSPLLLAKAFRGELVPQDPNDEPANALLERITAEREKAATQPRTRKSSAGRKPVRAPKENATMTKSRQDEDVQGQPYLARHLRLIGGAAPAEALFKASELPVADFYKQLAWEVANGHLRDGKTVLELGDAA
jgi:type I restriction enzyme S subunit